MNIYYSSDSDIETESHHSILSGIRSRHGTHFDMESSTVVCSGWMTKKARGRHTMGQVFGNTRLRWFELRCDGENHDTSSFCLIYFKEKGAGKKPKGEILLSALDSILRSESNPCEFVLQLERDTETKHRMLILLAEDEDCAEKWVEAFQGAILALNRLTTVTEADDEDRVTSAMMKTAISFRVATPSVGMEGVAGEAEGVHKQCDDVKWVKNKNKKPRATTIIGHRTSTAAMVESGQQIRKRDIVKGWIKGHNGSDVKGEEELWEWAKITGNTGNASCGAALMWCVQKDMEGGLGDDSEDDSEDDEDESEEGLKVT